MIGFGELRKRSAEWHMDLAVVERAYATDWLLQGISVQASLDSLVLRGSSALRYAYSSDYPMVEMPEFLATEPLDEADLDNSLTMAARVASETSGLAFALDSIARGNAKIRFTGPLGRRSAAQPHISLSFIPGKPRLASAQMPLLHPFSDACAATLSVVAIEELIGERTAMLAGTPRARDVFDLWFAATQVRVRIGWEDARAVARELAAARNIPVPRPDALFEPAHRSRLAGMWDSSLRSVPGHPAFEQVEKDLAGIV
jgi:predicted nucleotidyltransferase component of viral defense system